MLEDRIFVCWWKDARRELWCRGVVCDRRVGRDVFVSRRVVSDWLFKDGRSEGDDVLLTDTHAQVKETSQMSHLAIERK